MKKPNSFIYRTVVTVTLLLILLCPGMSWGDWSVLFFDDFDDGNFDGWSATHHVSGEPTTPPDVVPSPEGYSLRGIGSGYSNDPGLYVYLTYPITLNNIGELKIEMRAKSGPQWPNQANVILVSNSDFYLGRDYGESNQRADFDSEVNGVENRYSHSINANVWHDFAWTRDAESWWSLSIDDNEVWHNFCQDNQLTSFDKIGIHILRNQSEIEWVRISGIPEPEPLTGRIAFTSDRDGNFNIYLMNMDGSNQTCLTNHIGADVCPVFSPDGRTIAFFSNRSGSYRIYTMDLNGSEVREVPNSECEPGNTLTAGRGLAWSPSGDKLLFKSMYHALATIDLDGSNKTVLLTGGVGVHDYIEGVEWGPTTNDIYFNAHPYSWGYDQHIFHYSIFGNNWTQITYDVQPKHSHGPKISPDGLRIVFDRQFEWDGLTNICTMDLDGSNEFQLTFDGGFTLNYEPDWIGETKDIVFSSNKSGRHQIWLMDSTGGNLRMLEGEGNNYAPSWTPIPEPVIVNIDIKPGSYPNAINLGSHGLVPVAILSDEVFAATTVDPDTVELAGAGVAVRGKSNKYMAHEDDVDGDGLVDLVVQLATANLEPDSLQDGYAVLTGKTYDGLYIKGQDEITIVPSEE